ncbi:MAG: tRNA 4-thiouridine(8) synthase ThiI [Candidatus Beckwithbacteria bacterium]|nr:tRNA 4-thiouridine(8) synthase ThiI [Candidatus Beckwithbacteria bacterium]
MQKILVRYAEIGLKGGNRPFFENRLITNIKIALKNPSLQIIKGQKQIMISGENIDLDKLKNVFGIAWFAPVQESTNNLESISKIALQMAVSKKTFSVRAHRHLEVAIGDVIRTKKKIKVDLSHPQQTIYITEFNNQTLIFNQKIPGPGGLPVATSGKVLSLLSGGFDSIAASYLLAKRGAQVDFLHFHVFPDSKTVLQSKIKTIVDKLSGLTLSQNIYLASYLPFQMAVLDLTSRDEPQELVVYRRLMARVGEILAKKYGYQALVLGDSLGQVASQTMENICSVDEAVKIPIFRPLIGTDKKDIIALVKGIGLYEETIKPYKDCCSLISTHPAIKANFSRIQILEKKIKIDQIINQITTDVRIISL